MQMNEGGRKRYARTREEGDERKSWKLLSGQVHQTLPRRMRMEG